MLEAIGLTSAEQLFESIPPELRLQRPLNTPAALSEIELLDKPQLIKELCQLERRTRSGGRDVIDHPPGAHDDLANAVAGVVQACNTKRLFAGGLFFRDERTADEQIETET